MFLIKAEGHEGARIFVKNLFYAIHGIQFTIKFSVQTVYY